MKMTAVIDPTGTLDVNVGGHESTTSYSSVMEARRSVMSTATGLATDTDTATELHIQDPAGTRTVLVQADGGVIEQTATKAPDTPDAPDAGEEQQTEQVAGIEETAVVPAVANQSDAPVTIPEDVPEPEPTPAPAPAPVSKRAPKRAPRQARTAPPAAVAETAPKAEPVAESVTVDPVGANAHGAVAVLEPETTTAPAPTSVPQKEQELIVEQVPVEQEPAVDPVDPVSVQRTAMPSFVDRPEVEAPAELGVRGVLNRWGLKLAPSEAELSQRQDERTVSQHWAGPRTIVVLNPKGGAGKTPTVICLSAVFARLGGSGVLAWDNNNSLGSLGWRTTGAGHDATVVDLLNRSDHFMTAGARSGDLASYVHHQRADQYDVLRSDTRSGVQTRYEVTGSDVDRLHAVAAKYYRLILMDSGNTERGQNWEAMIGHADQVVIPVRSVDDAAEGASHVLSALRAGDEHAQALADRAVVVVLGGTPAHGKAKLDALAESFRPFVKAVVTVPFDASLVEGRIRFSSMRPGTRRAWLRAAATIAEEL